MTSTMNELGQQLLARVSYGFHEGVSRGVKTLLARKQQRDAAGPKAWKTMSEQAESRGFLPVVSVLGPRWNCHAALAGLGPLHVTRELVCRTQELHERAESWSLVLYDEQGKTVDWTGSCRSSAGEVSWRPPPGYYSLALRYYTSGPDMRVPNVIVDGVDYCVDRTIRGELPRYEALLESIRGKEGPYYRLLHYYVFHHLSRSQARPDAWLTSHFLPVGNPDTDWRFGHLAPGERLEVQRDRVRNVNTYISFYNWSSFPVHWCSVTEPSWQSPSFSEPVAYAMRLVRTAPQAETDSEISCRLLAP